MITEADSFEAPDPALVRAAGIANGMAYVPPPPAPDRDHARGEQRWDRTCWILLALAAAAITIDLAVNARPPW